MRVNYMLQRVYISIGISSAGEEYQKGLHGTASGIQTLH